MRCFVALEAIGDLCDQLYEAQYGLYPQPVEGGR